MRLIIPFRFNPGEEGLNEIPVERRWIEMITANDFKQLAWLVVLALSAALLVLTVIPVMSGSAAQPAGDREFRVIAEAFDDYELGSFAPICRAKN